MTDLFGVEEQQQAFPLRDIQETAILDIRKSFARGNRRVLFQLATGGGKTRIASEIVRMASAKGSRVMMLAPRRELIYQIEKAFRAQGIRASIIMAGEREILYATIHVASFDTLHARAIQRDKMELPTIDLLVVDEAHLAVADGRQDILKSYPDIKHLLLTATPARGDGRGLCEIADDLVLGPSMLEMIDKGYLVPLRYFAPSEPDLRAIKLNKDGDYQERALGKVMDDPKLVGDIIDNWFRIARDRRTVVFCTSRKHSRHVCEEFVKRGISAEHLDGETEADERAAILRRVESGETQVLCNVFVASYGLDIPALDCAVLARPTKNLTLYLQTVGRVMRTSPGKVDAIIIDHAGSVAENGRADDYHPWSLDGTEKIKDRIAKQNAEASAPKDITCSSCGYVFRSRRECPKCGARMIPPSEPVPTHKADLNEIDDPKGKATAAEKRNRSHSWDQKVQFMSEIRAFANERRKSDGWCAHKYRERYGVWPNDSRVKSAPPGTGVSPEIRSWIKAGMIRYARSRA